MDAASRASRPSGSSESRPAARRASRGVSGSKAASRRAPSTSPYCSIAARFSAFGATDHHDAGDRHTTRAQGLERQQRVIDGAERCARTTMTTGRPADRSDRPSARDSLIGTSTPPAPSTIHRSAAGLRRASNGQQVVPRRSSSPLERRGQVRRQRPRQPDARVSSVLVGTTPTAPRLRACHRPARCRSESASSSAADAAAR